MTKFEGPLPDEALPVGEEALTPDELDEVSEFFLGIQERHGKHGGPDLPSNVDDETLAAIRKASQRIEEDAFNIVRDVIIRGRDNRSQQ